VKIIHAISIVALVSRVRRGAASAAWTGKRQSHSGSGSGSAGSALASPSQSLASKGSGGLGSR
jgi:hypothetical protein